MNQFGDIILGLGLGLTIAALIANNWRQSKARVYGWSAEDAEKLTMPAHERLARQLAVRAGAPEFMWRRYTPLAVSIILRSPS
ncbi:hypothetical protein QA639_21470 [Bradyrhizobium pachyrhizi]|uniref:hypothetical protein n=1 Tax=Bradyrhizobium pachyrhizi TaxID=280333 RepID=UPI0024B1D906|nr:hypothetical protein [Bradyrhizobium pachyrhizi]WFU52281.1 hypothetical protein QA639_21470 [Bradyrhizobium pachyrhizi]